MRQAIRDKTKEMGLEKSVLSKQVIQQASARAMRGESLNLNNYNNALDLTKIRGNIPDNMPTVLYDPEDEMSSQERVVWWYWTYVIVVVVVVFSLWTVLYSCRPEGWTNMMTDDDVANLPSELRDAAAASSAAATSSGGSGGGGGGGLPDL